MNPADPHQAAKPWERCQEHGPAQPRVWACPACLVELRNWRAANEPRLQALAARVRELELAEEGAREAFGHVVQQKHDVHAECQRLGTLLVAAHAQIRTLARGSATNEHDPMAAALQELIDALDAKDLARADKAIGGARVVLALQRSVTADTDVLLPRRKL